MSKEKQGKEEPEDSMSSLFPDVIPLPFHDHYILPQPQKPLFIRSIRTQPPSHPVPHPFHFSDMTLCSSENEFRNSGVSFKILKELKRGRWPVTKKIDLHGLTLPQAIEKLETFFNQSLSEKHRCLLIIHGKGKNDESPLRALVRRGLTLNSHSVLAFCPATPTQGGNGATLVLLKKL